MKKIPLLARAIALSLMLFGWSCTKQTANEINNANNLAGKSTIDSNAVSMSIAIAAALQVQKLPMVNQMRKKAVNGINPFANKAILDSVAYPDKKNPSYYIFNYVGGGFTIIAADMRVEPILAFSDDGRFNTDTIKIPPGVKSWMSVNHKNMRILKANPKLKAPRQIIRLWKELAVKENALSTKLKVNMNAPAEPPCQEDYSVVSGVWPLLITQWDQWAPFNALCPATGLNDPLNDPAGCVATAMAQVLHYWQSGSSYNWSLMPTQGGGGANYPVALLTRDAGSSVNMNYSLSGSGAQADAIPGGFKNYFGYAAAYKRDYYKSNGDPEEILLLNNLDAASPVIFAVNVNSYPHAWVCDGYMRTDYYFCPTERLPDGASFSYLSLHMNWGWGPGYNGYYSFDYWYVFDGTSNILYSARPSGNGQYAYLIYGIHP